MTDLIQLIKDLEKTNPGILKKLDEVATAGLKKDKILVHEKLVKTNPNWKIEDIDNILTRHQNGTIDINWNVGEYRYRIVLSKRKLEKERKENTNGTSISIGAAIEGQNNSGAERK